MFTVKMETVALATGFGGGIGLTGYACGALLGAVNCRELCAPYEWQSKERILNCRKAVETAVEIAVEHILAGRTDGLMRTFGPNVAGAE